MDFGCSVSLLRLQLCFLSAACLRVEEALVGVAEALAALALVAGDELAWAPALLVEDGAALVAEGTAGVVLALALVFLRKLTTTYIQFFNAVPKPIYMYGIHVFSIFFNVSMYMSRRLFGTAF